MSSLNVHVLKIFKGFCHTHKALAELPFLKPLLGCSGRGLMFSPLQVWGVCSEESALSPGMRAPFILDHGFSQTQTCGCSELFSLYMQEYILAQNAPTLHRILKHNWFFLGCTKIYRSTNKREKLPTKYLYFLPLFLNTMGVTQNPLSCSGFLCCSSQGFWALQSSSALPFGGYPS